MELELDIDRIQRCWDWALGNSEKYRDLLGDERQLSLDDLIKDLGHYTHALALMNHQMVVAKKLANEAQARALAAIGNSKNLIAQKPLLAKEYAQKVCANEIAMYDLCERGSRTITHTMTALQVCIAAMKEEMKMNGWASRTNTG